jgi:hypothetical protein
VLRSVKTPTVTKLSLSLCVFVRRFTAEAQRNYAEVRKKFFSPCPCLRHSANHQHLAHAPSTTPTPKPPFAKCRLMARTGAHQCYRSLGCTGGLRDIMGRAQPHEPRWAATQSVQLFNAELSGRKLVAIARQPEQQRQLRRPPSIFSANVVIQTPCDPWLSFAVAADSPKAAV